ncbi:MAG: addiction module protein [Tepidisphaerales bacterium]
MLTREQILHGALELDPGERESLADQLLRSLDTSSSDPVEAAWIAEAERRLEAIQ